MSSEQDFWSHVDIQDKNDCWLWKLSVSKSGYGQFKFNHINQSVHRLAWELTNGEIPDRINVLHDPVNCGNKLCCNPNHLRLGTHTENMQDEDRAKLDWNKVREIRKLYKKSSHDYNCYTLADMYNVSYGEIGMIVRNEIWRE